MPVAAAPATTDANATTAAAAAAAAAAFDAAALLLSHLVLLLLLSHRCRGRQLQLALSALAHCVRLVSQGAIVAIENPERRIFGLQYHPEVVHRWALHKLRSYGQCCCCGLCRHLV